MVINLFWSEVEYTHVNTVKCLGQRIRFRDIQIDYPYFELTRL